MKTFASLALIASTAFALPGLAAASPLQCERVFGPARKGSLDHRLAARSAAGKGSVSRVIRIKECVDRSGSREGLVLEYQLQARSGAGSPASLVCVTGYERSWTQGGRARRWGAWEQAKTSCRESPGASDRSEEERDSHRDGRGRGNDSPDDGYERPPYDPYYESPDSHAGDHHSDPPRGGGYGDGGHR